MRAAAFDRRRSRRAGMTIPFGSGVDELDLDPDDRADAHRLRFGREADHAIEAPEVGDREPGQAELDRPADEILDRRGAVEEREVRTAVKLRVGRWHARGPAAQGRFLGLPIIEQMFYPWRRNIQMGCRVRGQWIKTFAPLPS